jgi:DNA-binding transcriptional MocR family regulator
VPDEIVEHIEDRSARGIAAAVSRLITNGGLPPGARLPTVRDLARQLGISPTTVSEAWRLLAAVGAIDAHGRRGTFVVDAPRPRGPRRYRRVTEGPGHFPLDLSTGTPDPALLPDLGPILARVARQTLTTSYLDDPVIPALDEALRGRWPFPPEALTVVDGAMDALDRITSIVVRLGDRVMVEHPCFPPLLDLLEQVGADTIGLPMDDQGIVAESMEAALEQRPVALYLQPRAQNPTGVSMTPVRARQLAALLRPTNVVVIEDDHAGAIAASELVSLGRHLPERTVHVESYSKSHGPDLRLAAVGGAGEVIAGVANRRLLGPGWSSRLLQCVLVEMLDDPATVDVVERARTTYAERRKHLVAALDGRDIASAGTDGINLWVEVRDEQSALLTLASRGVGAAPGAPFMVSGSPAHSDHLRLTCGLVPGNYDELADLVAAAASGPAVWSRGL